MSVLFRGSVEQRARLITGLILFSFALTHFLNHALGLYSLEAMQAAQAWRFTVTRTTIGGIVLGGAAIVHILLGLRKLAFRATLKMPFWEAAQLALGLSIPLLLIPHMVPMRFAPELFGVDTSYMNTLIKVWQGRPWLQSLLLLVVWTHACIGLNFWLRLTSWYRKLFMPLFALAVAIPLAGLAGFMVSGRALEAKLAAQPAAAPSTGYSTGGYGEEEEDYGYASDNPAPSQQAKTIAELIEVFRYVFIGLLGLTALVYTSRMVARRFGARVKINYAQGPTIKALAGPTLLEISRMHNIPHASVCGGRGRCSTCRVRVEEGLESLGPRSAVEVRTLASVNAGPNDRLACQIKPSDELGVIRILRPASAGFSARDFTGSKARGEERDLAVMFLDVRGFTAMSAGKLPYDVVFILNQLFDATGRAIQAEGGWIDKYLGDGLMAVFGREGTAESGCRQSLRAARAIDIALDDVNAAIAEEAGGAIKIGMGIHVGPLVLGEIGHAGSAALTVIGRTVNAAARLEALTKEQQCQLIISADVAARAGLSSLDRPRISVQVRGIPEPLDVICFPGARDLPG